MKNLKGKFFLLYIELMFFTLGYSKKSYAGYQLFSVSVQSPEDIAFLKTLPYVQLWNEPIGQDKHATILVPPYCVNETKDALSDAHIETSTVTHDIQRWIDEISNDMKIQHDVSRGKKSFRLSTFHNHAAINKFLQNVAAKCKRGVFHMDVSCEVITIGKTYEGRNLDVLHIHSQGTKAIWIDAGIHAREWGAPASAIYLIYKLLSTADTSPASLRLLKEFDWYILPSANPDGYEYSILEDRMWRKTRSNSDSMCPGVDPNRNFGFHWNEQGASSDPCSEIYAGPEPFSEPETKAISNFILEHADKIKVYLSLHAYGQYWLTPWGFTEQLPSDHEQLLKVANTAADAIERTYGNAFVVGSSTNVLYAASGGSDDWAKGAAGIKYSFTVEIRDYGWYGFIMPPSEIIPCGKEIWAGIQAMAEEILEQLQ